MTRDADALRVPVVGATLDVSQSGSGDPLIWMHGLTSSRADQLDAGLYATPHAPGWRTVDYDARGHGRSTASPDPDDYRWPRLAGDLLAVADAAGASRFVAAGASMGAATALHAALAAPERVRALILAIPPTAWGTRRAQAGAYEAGADLVESEGLAAYTEAMLNLPPHPVAAELGARWDRNRRRRLAGLDGAALPSVLRGAARSDLPPLADLATVAQPAMIVAWPGDPVHPVETAEALAATLPRAELHVAADLADVQGWADRMVSWLDRLRGAGAPAS